MKNPWAKNCRLPSSNAPGKDGDALGAVCEVVGLGAAARAGEVRLTTSQKALEACVAKSNILLKLRM